MPCTYRWEYLGNGEGYGWVCHSGRTKWPRPTGMIWRGGVLAYRWWIGPVPEFWHWLNRRYTLAALENLKMCQPVQTAHIPARNGNPIQFFTYKL